MTQKRKVGPGGGDFALNPNRFSGGGGGKSIVTGRQSSVSKQTKNKIERRYPESAASKNEKKHLVEKGKKAEQKKKKFAELKAEEKSKGKAWVQAFKRKHGYTPSEAVYMTPTEKINSQVKQMKQMK